MDDEVHLLGLDHLQGSSHENDLGTCIDSAGAVTTRCTHHNFAGCSVSGHTSRTT